MGTLSLGKWHGLQKCASARGTFTMLALDHRQNLRRMFRPQAQETVSDLELVEFKLAATRELAPAATAVLLDPEFGAAQSIASGALPNCSGLIVAVEATGYTGEPTARQSRLLPGWGVAQAKRLGAHAVKLLVYFHPAAPTAAAIENFVRQIADECVQHDIPLCLEPLSYPLDSAQHRLPPSERTEVVIETARRLTRVGVDLLKAEFPVDPAAEPNERHWQTACEALSAASAVPWVLLSAAADFDMYLRQATTACRAGAAGVAVGRAVWQEAVPLETNARTTFLRGPALARLERLRGLCEALARPWVDCFGMPEVKPDWYHQYVTGK